MFTSNKRELLQLLARIVARKIIQHLLDYVAPIVASKIIQHIPDYGFDQWPLF
jgi:hypothetical protein